MDEITEMQKRLITWLVAFGVQKDTVTAILLMLPEDKQIYKLMEWLADNREATETQIFHKAVKIMEAISAGKPTLNT